MAYAYGYVESFYSLKRRVCTYFTFSFCRCLSFWHFLSSDTVCFQFLSKSARRMGLLSFVYLHFHVDEKIPFNRIHSK